MKVQDKKRLSKYMSLLLRHKPGDLELDSRGCCKLNDLLKVLNAKLKFRVSKKDVVALTIPSEDLNVKTRFELEGDYIRAGHGHSILIEGYKEMLPDRPLYHATTSKAVDLIRKSGLCAMNRQKVHLSYDKAITIEAAKRRSKNVVLIQIDVLLAIYRGVNFYRSADERIVLSDDIPFECLKLSGVNDEEM